MNQATAVLPKTGDPGAGWPLQWCPALQHRRQTEPLVLLHGWGCDHRSWQPLLAQLNQAVDVILVDLPGFGAAPPIADADDTGDDFIQRLLTALPERFALLGWSLGGMLATRLAARFPRRVTALITLATNAQFVADEDWMAAMPRADFDDFSAGFSAAPTATLKRFAALMARGDADERGLVKSLRQQALASLEQATAARWQPGLRWLWRWDNRVHFAALKQPGLHLLADGDALVPVRVQSALQALNRQQRVEVISGASHAVHWSAPAAVAAAISAFLRSVPHTVDKRRVAESFGRAAEQYDSVAQVQRQIGRRLLQGLGQPGPGPWLDLGCGTGYFTPQLADRCDAVLGLDLAEAMLRFARQRLRNERPAAAAQWLCADAEALPLADASVAGVFSSLAIQWCAHLPRLFAELQRVVSPGGRILLATLGPDTLQELRRAWSAVDDYTHVNHFASEVELRAAIDGSGLQLARWESEHIVLRYPAVRDLTYALKTLGAHNMNYGQRSGLTSRQRLLQFKHAYEQFRVYEPATGGEPASYLPATYQVFYLELIR